MHAHWATDSNQRGSSRAESGVCVRTKEALHSLHWLVRPVNMEAERKALTHPDASAHWEFVFTTV
ncbi:hypothetical protein GCM10018952_47660 [Streptosporangium vulgare]